jgi:glyoxylase-like metal-dependent hydrolase (beta-lactamase superfamily II)
MSDTPYEVIKLTDSCWRIEENMVRMFLFEGSDRALLVDTGFGGGDLKAVVGGLTQKPLIVVNTHADGDHTGCNGQFDKIHLHPSEFAQYFKQPPKNPEVRPLQDGEVLDLGGRRFEVILIPGHSAGSIALLDRENRLIVTGDTISEGPVFMFGTFRSFPAYKVSLQRLAALSGAFDTIYPSHGPFPVGKETIGKLLAAAKSYTSGELEGQEPPYELPAKMYLRDGVGFFAD